MSAAATAGVTLVSAVLVGFVIGRIDAALLERFQNSEPLLFMALLIFGGIASAIPAALLGKSVARAVVITLVSLAVEFCTCVFARGCGRQGDCAQAVVESLLAPMTFIFLFVALPALAVVWRFRGSRGTN